MEVQMTININGHDIPNGKGATGLVREMSRHGFLYSFNIQINLQV
jgi:hypothetical protein